MEWTTPIDDINDTASLKLTRDVYRTIIKKMVDTFSLHHHDPYQALPVSIAAELRLIAASDSLLSPTCARGGAKYMGAPEVITHSIGNKNYENFLLALHEDIKKKIHFGQ